MKKKLLLGIISLILTNTCFPVEATEADTETDTESIIDSDDDKKEKQGIDTLKDEEDDVPPSPPVEYCLVFTAEDELSYDFDVLKLKNEDDEDEDDEDLKTLKNFYQTKENNVSGEGEMGGTFLHKMFFGYDSNSLNSCSWQEYDDDVKINLYRATQDDLQDFFKNEEKPPSEGINIIKGLDGLAIYQNKTEKEIYKDVRSKLLPKINKLETSFLSRHRNKFILGGILSVVISAGYWVLSSSKKEQTEVGNKYEDE